MSRHADLTVRWYESETALSVQDVHLPHTTAAGSQRFAGKRSLRRRSTPPIRSSALCRRAIPPLLATISTQRPTTDHHAGSEARCVASPQG